MVHHTPYILGLDLGSSSLGWAAISLDRPGGEPNSIIKAGVRIFEAGVEGDIEQGRDASRAVVRRQARQPRRQQWRRQHRKQKLFRLLQQFGLLPPSDGAESATRKAVLDQLDSELAQKHLSNGDHDAAQKLPYRLRDLAVSGPITPFELGRALYHLGQRRGYLSNRKSQGDDDDQGVVVSQIGELDDEKGPLTIGSHFSRNVDPHVQRIRRRYTGRSQYHDEFEKIREVQSPHHSLSESDWKKIHDAIYFQRPLKSQKHLIGRCELEPQGRKWKYRRCPLALNVAQEFRLLQKVNDLRVTTGDRTNSPLSEDERAKLIEALRIQGDLSWAAVKKLLKLPAKDKTKFSLEEWDTKGIVGHRTNAKMIAVFGDRWAEMPQEQRDAITLDVVHYRKPEALKKRAMSAWGLSEEAAELLTKTHPEDDHASHSRQALTKLIEGSDKQPGMKDGASYSTVRKALYPDRFSAGKSYRSLPPVNEWKQDIRNPAVIRALTELRKVINSLIRKYGKPERIRIELARDIRNSRQKRKDIWRKNEENRKRREKAAAAMLNECGISKPLRRDTEKWLLAEECNRECPYCGKAINMKQLMGDDAAFNIEHIYPRRFLDDSYFNKTIACRTCNDKKGDLTPAQAFSGSQLEAILQRVERFQGSARDVKLKRFRTELPPSDFAERQLNDTRYNSRMAAEYLGLLYGGRNDGQGHQRIYTPNGQLTASIRGKWHLNDLLSGTSEKEREDHRHHAIDAIVVAFLDQQMIHQLESSAEEAEKVHDRHFFKSVSWPWTDFKNSVAYAIEDIRVSHRPTRTIAGPLHAESIYSKNLGSEKKPEYRIRKHLSKLTPKEIQGDQIADPKVREAVQKKYKSLGGEQPSKLWGDDDQRDRFPRLEGPNGGSVIRKVRLRVDAKPRAVGNGVRQRNYASGKDSNYACMIYAILDKDGHEIRWEHEITDRLTAHERLSANHRRPGEKVLLPIETDTRRFKFALRKNDMLEADGPDGDRELYRVQKFSQNEIQLCEHTRSTITNTQRTPWNRITSTDNFRKRNAVKVDVSAIGEVTESAGQT